MFEVWYVLPKGKHMCMVCTSEAALVTFISKLRRSARIMQDGQHIGKVFHDGNKWGWFYSPNGTPNKACSGLADTSPKLASLAQPANR